MSNNQVVVSVNDVSKTFHIPLEASNGIKQKLINYVKGRKGYREFSPLNGISFTIEEGDFFGIVGRNGSGKSTLLKTIAGIYSPTKGSVDVVGSLVPFIELGVGFNPELTGRENVYLNGALLGFSRSEMDVMYDGIVKFAELHDFMEERLKNYSSGMQVRLAFSIAIRAKGDILLLDEVLAVGDEAFQLKCFSYFEQLKRDKKTVILVTHDMASVERFCNKAMLIEAGSIIETGDPQIVAHAYRKLFSPEEDNELIDEDNKKRWGTKDLEVVKLSVKKTGSNDSRVEVDVTIKCNTPIKDRVIIAYTIKTKDRRALFGEGMELTNIDSTSSNYGQFNYKFSFSNLLSQDDYYMDISLREASKETYFDFWIDATRFSIKDRVINGLNILADSRLE